MTCVKAVLALSACAMVWIVGIGHVVCSTQPPAHALSNRNRALMAATVRTDLIGSPRMSNHVSRFWARLC